MFLHPLIKSLNELRLRGMASAFERQLQLPDVATMTFDDRLALLVEHERVDRTSQRLAQRLRWAKLTQSAALEDLDTKTACQR